MIRKAINHFDLFQAPPTLRIKEESSKANTCSGLFSILLYLGFMAIFINSLISIFRYEAITSEITDSVHISISKIQVNASSVSNIPFAIGILGVNISKLNSLFTVGARVHGINDSFTFNQCTIDLLPGISEKQFQQMELQDYLCVNEPQKIILKGFVTDPESTFLEVFIEPCDSQSLPDICHPDVEAKIQEMVNLNGRLIASFIPLTTGFNPSNKNATFKFAEKAAFYMVFTHKSQSQQVLYAANFKVKSDESVLPFQQFQEESGHYYDENFPIYSPREQGQLFFAAYVFASPRFKQIKRVYGKIDQVFSYIGGLFGIILSFISIFMMSFNEYRYELEVADDNFSMKTDRVKEKNMHFFKYVKYTIYDWLKILFCCSPNWEDCHRIQEARDEAINQLQVCQLLRRINNLEKMFKEQDHETDADILYYVTKPDDISQARRTRLIKNYIDKMNLHDQSQTIEEINASEEGKQQIMIADPENKSSLKIIEQYLQKHCLWISQCLDGLNLQECDLEAEKMLGDLIWGLKEEKRKKMYRKIPLNILYRLYENRKASKDNIVYFNKNEDLKLNSSSSSIQLRHIRNDQSPL